MKGLALLVSLGLLKLAIAQTTYHIDPTYAGARIWGAYFPIVVEDGYRKLHHGWKWFKAPGNPGNNSFGTCFGGLSLSIATPTFPYGTGVPPILNIDGPEAGVSTWLGLNALVFQDTGGTIKWSWVSSEGFGINATEFNVQRGRHRITPTFSITVPEQFNAGAFFGSRSIWVSRRMALGYSGGTLDLELRDVDVINSGEVVIGTLSNSSVVRLLGNTSFSVGGTNSSTIGEYGGTGRLSIASGTSFSAASVPLFVGIVGGTGTIDASGPLTSAKGIFVGHFDGTGRLNVTGKPVVDAGDNLVVGSSNGRSGRVDLNGASGAAGDEAKLRARRASFADGGSAVFNSSYGQFLLNDELFLGNGGTFTGQIHNSYLSSGGYLLLGGGGTATLTASNSYFGFGAGISIGAGGQVGGSLLGNGTANISHSRVLTNQTMIIGSYNTGTATMNASNTQLTAAVALKVGLNGNGSLAMTDSTGTFGELAIATGEWVGRKFGTLDLFRSTVTASSLSVGTVGAEGVLALRESSLTVANNAVFGGAGKSDVSINGASTLTIGGTLNVGHQFAGTNVIAIGSNSLLAAGSDISLGVVGPTTTTMNGGTLRTPGVLRNGTNGAIKGTGKLEFGTLNNEGLIDPGFSPGTLDLKGTLRQTTGTLRLEVGGPGNSDLLRVDGAVNLEGGKVIFEKVPGYVPALGDEVKLIEATSIVEGNVDYQDQTGLGLQFSGAGSVQVTKAPGMLTGRIALADWLGAITSVPVQYELRKGGTTVAAGGVDWKTADGLFGIPTNETGAVELWLKGSHWLARKVNVQIDSQGSTFVQATLVNGDVDEDNAVTVFDYALLSDAFDTYPGDPAWNASADLDGDEAVTVFDYAILSESFDQSGDE